MVIKKENIIMKKFYILISLFTFLLTGCEEDNLHKPYAVSYTHLTLPTIA